MQLAWDEEDSTQVAIKFVARGSAYLSRAAEREILNHRLLTGHAHIVQFKEARSCTSTNGAHILRWYCSLANRNLIPSSHAVKQMLQLTHCQRQK